jgi:DNA-binding response OmpR family regulator
MAPHILLVHNEYEIARFVEMKLKSKGYSVDVVYAGTHESSLMKNSDPDLVILNPMTTIPMLTSLDFLWRLKSVKNKIPVILLTTKNKIDERITNLNIGINDYLVQPFSFDELLTKIHTHLGSPPAIDVDLLQFEDLTLNCRTREVYRGSLLIELTTKEFDLLQYLMSNPDQIFNNRQIFDNVWGYDSQDNLNDVNVYSRYLRLKLSPNNEEKIINTSCRQISMKSSL